MDTLTLPQNSPLNWKRSLLWLVVAVACFHGAYTSIHHPVAGLLVFGYALGLVQLANQSSVRRAFYFGLGTAFLCYGPQLWFFFKIFSVAAVVLWVLLAFWVGLFTALVCGCMRRWGRARTAWLVPVLWTGIEYFRSELYYLKFSWLNTAYALSGLHPCLVPIGMYGCGFLIFGLATSLGWYGKAMVLRFVKLTLGDKAEIALTFAVLCIFYVFATQFCLLLTCDFGQPRTPLQIVGIQMEFPPEKAIPKMLDKALAKNTNAPLFVLSEYTLTGPVPQSLKDWCRQNHRYLVVGGEDPVGTNDYYDSAFVVGTNGEVVFKQGKCVPIQFFKDGLPAPGQSVWNSPWGKIGFCVCYDLSYTRVTDELARQGAQLIIVPTMDLEDWGAHQHELHTRVAPVRAAEYGIPIFRLASSGISQAVSAGGKVIAEAPMPGNGSVMVASVRLRGRGLRPLDRWLAPICTGLSVLVLIAQFWYQRQEKSGKKKPTKSIY